MAVLGDFAFCAGTPGEELVRFKPESCEQDFIIMEQAVLELPPGDRKSVV